jgi:hypothetical protein
MNEIWKDIVGYEGRYQVSNLGNVRSLNWRNKGIVKPVALKSQNRGYLHVLLYEGKKCQSFLVHRLVASVFIPCPDETMTVNHIDENPSNNRVDNLEWCSLEENINKFQSNHPEKVGRPKNLTPVIQLDMKGGVIRIWESITDICKNRNYNAWSISQCCNRKRKTAYGYMWQYAT